MKSVVFTFDIWVGLITLIYILLPYSVTETPVNGFILDLSVLKRLSDNLIVKYFSESDYNSNNTCFPLHENCSEAKDLLCNQWKYPKLQDNGIVFDQEILCMEVPR
jgi:hypothetical protein